MIIINGLVQFFINNASNYFCMLVSRHGIHGARMGLTFYFVYKCPHKKRHFYTITISIDVYDWMLDPCMLDLFFD